MSWPKELAQIGRLLLNGQLTELKTVLDGYKARTASEARIKAHYMALIDFHKGDIAQARIGLEKAVADFGENVNLMRDLATCFYHQQDMLAFRLCLDKLERTLIEQEDKLSRRSFLECETMIGKFLEEEGKLAPALIFYERALLRTNSPGERLRVILQKARWVALYEPSHELGSLYRELISVPTDSVSQDMRIEIEHNLLLIELRLIGADHAWQRFERLGSDVPEIDRRLLIFDFIEGCLAQDIAISSAVLAMIDQFKTFDPYEDFLRKLIHGQLGSDQNPGAHQACSQIAVGLLSSPAVFIGEFRIATVSQDGAQPQNSADYQKPRPEESASLELASQAGVANARNQS